MKNLILILLFSTLGISGCKASDKDDIDNFIKTDFRNYVNDNRDLIIEANKNIKVEPAIKEIIFKNTFVKVETARSLLDDEYASWLEGLDKNKFDYTDLNTICWMTEYMNNYVHNMDDSYRKNIKEETINNVKKLYEQKAKIIQLRESKDKTLENHFKKCQ